MRVYLAGPIAGLTYEGCTEWRDWVSERLGEAGIACYSPMRGKGYLVGEKKIGTQKYKQVLSTDKAIVARDKMDVLKADLIICNLAGAKQVSIGTMFELAWAALSNKPIVLVMSKDDNVHDHPFVREAVGFVVESLAEAVEMAKHILFP